MQLKLSKNSSNSIEAISFPTLQDTNCLILLFPIKIIINDVFELNSGFDVEFLIVLLLI